MGVVLGSDYQIPQHQESLPDHRSGLLVSILCWSRGASGASLLLLGFPPALVALLSFHLMDLTPSPASYTAPVGLGNQVGCEEVSLSNHPEIPAI